LKIIINYLRVVVVRINLEAAILKKNEPPADRGGTLPTWGPK
jgi:hypothetical protein